MTGPIVPPNLFFRLYVYKSSSTDTQEFAYSTVGLSFLPVQWTFTSDHFPHLDSLRSVLHLLAAEVSSGVLNPTAGNELDSLITDFQGLPETSSAARDEFLAGRSSQVLDELGSFCVAAGPHPDPFRPTSSTLSGSRGTMLASLQEIKKARQSQAKGIKTSKSFRRRLLKELSYHYHVVNAAIEIIGPICRQINNKDRLLCAPAKALEGNIREKLRCVSFLLHHGYQDFTLRYFQLS